MKYIISVISVFLILGFTTDQTPTIQLELSQKVNFGDPSERCFGCGDCSVYCAIENEFSITASSVLPNQGTQSYAANQVSDYNLKSAWVEGKEGLGIGEWIEFQFNHQDFASSEIEFTELYLFNGYRKSRSLWEKNARIKTLRMLINGKETATLQLHNAYTYQSAKIPKLSLREIKSIRFEIVDAYKGTQFDDVALSELRFIGTHHH